MDTDVVVISNLNGLIFSVKENTNKIFFSWRENSGFLVMNCFKFEIFFPFLESVNLTKIRVNHIGKRVIWSDQSMLGIFQENYPDLVGHLPMKWFNHIGHGYRSTPQLLANKANVGFLHFTGSGTGESYFSDQGLIKFCERGRQCNPLIESHVTDFQKSWGLADYYIRIPWEWVIFQGVISRVNPKKNEKFLTVVFK